MPEDIERRISFNGGEISPWTDARVDLDKYRSSCRKLVNMQPTIYGGAYRRPGSVFIGACHDSTAVSRLEAFEYSYNSGAVRANVVMEFGEGFVRIFSKEASVGPDATLWGMGLPYIRDDYVFLIGSPTVYRCLIPNTSSGSFATDLAAGKWEVQADYILTTPYLQSEVFGIQFVQQNDVIFAVHPMHQPIVISRVTEASFTIRPFLMEWPTVRDLELTGITLTPSAVTGNITLTASAPVFDAGHIGSRWLIIYRREDPSVEIDLKVSAPGTTTAPLFVLGEWSCNIRASSSGYGDFNIKILVERSYDKVTWETLRTLGSEKASIQGVITGTEIDPCFLRIRYLSNSGTIPVGTSAVLEALDPDQYGIVEITSFASITSAGAKVLFELGGTTATKLWNEAAWSDFRGWPRAICLHEQRLYFAGNTAQPQTIWGSVTDDYTNFRIGTDADQGLSLTIAADQSFGIVWLLSKDSLLVGTGGSEWVIGGSQGGTALSPTDARAKRSSSYGSEPLQAVAAQDASLFVQRAGRQVRELFYSFEKDNLVANDLVLLAEHITGTGIKQIAIQKNPGTILWCITNDGRLIGLSYERGQNVAGWFQFKCDDADDRFESVAVGNDVVYVATRRRSDGGFIRYLEYFQPGVLDVLRLYTSGPIPQSLVFADCAKVVNGAEPFSSFTGFDYLEGRTVNVVADGGLHPDVVVTDGTITLDYPATNLIVGLPYASLLEPTYLEGNDPNSLLKVAKKRVKRVLVEFYRSLGCEASTNGGGFDPIPFRNVTDGAVTSLFSGERELTLGGSTARQVSCTLRSKSPLPLVILSMHVWCEANTL